ncbi:alpha/beta fold hydrolase [Xylanibacter oryzae]|uniref:alpha/beta fold hydrolase n=1 Tax=Xylanibacter oryzae TaxID=185293 RepID=UPI0004B2882F|nr:alpha/beta fold hydrolase [Xylanibacter oryzae]
MDKTIKISLKVRLKHLRYNTQKCKPFAVLFILCAAFLLLTQCSAPHTLPYSVCPTTVPKGITLLSVKIDGLDADFFHGTSTTPQKAIVLLGGSEGGRSWSYHPEFIQELIDHGFCVLSLPYFGTDSLPKNLRGISLEYFQKAFRWLSAQKDMVISNNYALVGVSRGAELALLLGSRYPEVNAVVAIDPSSVVFPGPPTGLFDALGRQHSAWSEKGRELPFVSIPFSWTSIKGMFSGNRTRMFEKALQDTIKVKAATIPVEKIHGPVLVISFKRDQVWPSPLMCEKIVARLHDKNFKFYYEHASYDGVHSDWSIKACRTNIISFLSEQFLPVESK